MIILNKQFDKHDNLYPNINPIFNKANNNFNVKLNISYNNTNGEFYVGKTNQIDL